jgi:thiol-disulfide isomerase/thioredoxin
MKVDPIINTINEGLEDFVSFYKKNYKFYTISMVIILLFCAVLFYIYVIPQLNKAALVGTQLFDQVKDGEINLKKLFMPIVNNKSVEGMTSQPKNKVILFFADWCPHCTAAKEPWSDFIGIYSEDGKPVEKDEFTKQYFGTINDEKVTFDTVDCTNRADKFAQQQQEKYDVAAYPTIVFQHESDDPKTFNDSITSEKLQKWLDNLLD